MDIAQRTRAYLPVATAHRRALHRIPESGYAEEKTRAYILEELGKLSPDQVRTFARTGVRAVFRAKGKASRCVAFRADMDALHIGERSGCAFASEHPGMMHACGHDGHMANLLTLARYIADARDALGCDVVLLFQPAEETVGGAKRMIDEGALENPHVDEVYGMHLMPDVPLGKIGTCAGPLMASTTELDIDLTGRSAHGAMPHLGVDTVAAAAHLYTLLQTMVARTVDPCKNALITIGRMEAGAQRNVLAATAHMEGIIRTLSNQVYEDLHRRILECVRATETAFGVTGTISERVFYPCVENDAEKNAHIEAILGDSLVPLSPRMIAEDFAYYQLERPGVFVFCGCMDQAHSAPLHSDAFDFDERALLYALELFVQLIDWRQAIASQGGTTNGTI